MSITKRVYYPVSERYLRALMALQKGVDEKLQNAVVCYLTSEELMRTAGSLKSVCDSFNVLTTSYHRQIARMVEIQKEVDVLFEEVAKNPNEKRPMSFLEMASID